MLITVFFVGLLRVGSEIGFGTVVGAGRSFVTVTCYPLFGFGADRLAGGILLAFSVLLGVGLVGGSGAVGAGGRFRSPAITRPSGPAVSALAASAAAA